MPARLLLEVTIRVLGLWSLYSAVASLAQSAGMTLSVIGMVGPPTRWLFVGQVVVPFVVQCFLGAMLIWWAPRIAARFYPAGANEAEVRLSVGPGDVFRIACFILGVHLLLTAA